MLTGIFNNEQIKMQRESQNLGSKGRHTGQIS